ncbi:NAD(P)H-binding protein [Marinicella rhabdoformis]|uniref:NAD(P)H-binding protein n=1 Tax=Marinicella rhabdoformis TaxID=2580566 RepID=UPI0012AEC206|nr:NAD(P)H-binding protein [Marinicella rhabdoformis]
MKTAVVIGATGLVGGRLVGRLVNEAGFKKVIAVTRRPVTYQSSKVINDVVDFNALENHKASFQGDVLFSCLGTTAKQAGSIAAQRVVDYDYQYEIAKFAADNGMKHYVLVSSAGADANSRSSYLKMKGELEDAVSLLAFERISIMQPSLLLGEREGFRLGETIGSWVMPALCKLPFLKKYRPITGDEVAKKMVAVALTPKSGAGVKQVFALDEIF